VIIVIKNRSSTHLGIRLKTIADMVDECEVLVDIGTDHGLLPIYLLEKKIIIKAIATDICISPLEQAKKNAKKKSLLNKMDFIVSDGLNKINKKFNYIVIAGLGTRTIVNILKNAKIKLNKDHKIIVQSNNGCYLVRKWGYLNGLIIEDEKMIKENKIYYEIIKFKFDDNKNKVLYSENDLIFGPILLKNKDLLLKERIEKEQEKLLDIIKKIPKNKTLETRNVTLKYDRNKEILDYLNL